MNINSSIQMYKKVTFKRKIYLVIIKTINSSKIRNKSKEKK